MLPTNLGSLYDVKRRLQHVKPALLLEKMEVDTVFAALMKLSYDAVLPIAIVEEHAHVATHKTTVRPRGFALHVELQLTWVVADKAALIAHECILRRFFRS